MKPAKKINNVLIAFHCSPVALPSNQVEEWQHRWRSTYAHELHIETGLWVLDDYDWLVFSAGKHAMKSGDEAWSEYRRLGVCSFLVLSAYTKDVFGFRSSGKPPERLEAGIDLVVTPTSLEWTMSFDHEGYGPYFATP